MLREVELVEEDVDQTAVDVRGGLLDKPLQPLDLERGKEKEGCLLSIDSVGARNDDKKLPGVKAMEMASLPPWMTMTDPPRAELCSLHRPGQC